MLNLRRMRVHDVAIPKAEIIAAPLNISLEDLVTMFREHGFTRIPVFRGTLDSPLGLIHLKDLALKHGFGAGGKFTLRPMLRPMLYVPPSMPIGVLLQQMQQKRIHMALVIDEYGGVDGLVTIEDLIEQVIGEIEDEHDEDESGLWVSEKPGQWLIQARAPLAAIFPARGGLRAPPWHHQPHRALLRRYRNLRRLLATPSLLCWSSSGASRSPSALCLCSRCSTSGVGALVPSTLFAPLVKTPSQAIMICIDRALDRVAGGLRLRLERARAVALAHLCEPRSPPRL